MIRDSIIPGEIASTPRSAGAVGRMARGLVHRSLQRIEFGRLTIQDPWGTRSFGHAKEDSPGDYRDVHLHVTDPRFYMNIAAGGDVGAGEAFIRGWWQCDNLVGLIRMMIANDASLRTIQSRWGVAVELWNRARHWFRSNTRRGSRRNIAAHYDLSNDFYRLFLDPTMMYSCGIFESPASTMHDASIAKLDRVCRKLRLRPGDHLLEIGTGWGGLALHAARNYGCRVTTTTISRQQHDYAAARIAESGLGNRITLLFEDYRDLRGRFDKLVSIEMIEAVGHRYYDAYFRQCCRLLRPHGAALIQAITIADRFYAAARDRVDFIKKFVFPGSCIPSISAMMSSIARQTDLTLVHLEDITPHYATTLARWREAFMQRRSDVRALGLGDAFIRLWEFYLAYCEAGFRERTIGNVQLLLHKPGCTQADPLPPGANLG